MSGLANSFVLERARHAHAEIMCEMCPASTKEAQICKTCSIHSSSTHNLLLNGFISLKLKGFLPETRAKAAKLWVVTSSSGLQYSSS
jgi:hypothetical protein